MSSVLNETVNLGRAVNRDINRTKDCTIMCCVINEFMKCFAKILNLFLQNPYKKSILNFGGKEIE